jgi:rubrerythrin
MAIILVVGILKGLRSKDVVCDNCGTMFRLMSSQNRCPDCGNQTQPFSP